MSRMVGERTRPNGTRNAGEGAAGLSSSPLQVEHLIQKWDDTEVFLQEGTGGEDRRPTVILGPRMISAWPIAPSFHALASCVGRSFYPKADPKFSASL
jgi:hypothetical protein